MRQHEEQDSIACYLASIGGNKVLTLEEERHLAMRITQGDEEARTQFIAANLKLVVSVAKRYQGQGLPLEDLIQEGNIGLLRAVERFDWTRNYKFSTYAHWWIRQAITRALADQGRIIRLPVHLRDTLARLRRITHQLQQKLGRDPTIEEVAGEINIPATKIREMLQASQTIASLDQALDEDEDLDLADVLEDGSIPPPVDVVSHSLLREQVEALLSRLSERERAILSLRYGLTDGTSRSLEEVGKVFHVTRERIRQLEARALETLRGLSTMQHFTDYLE